LISNFSTAVAVASLVSCCAFLSFLLVVGLLIFTVTRRGKGG
jgi:hypothetical protein